MKKQALEIQYTIRGIPTSVDQALRRKAMKGGRSLNQLVVEELTAATIGSSAKADFSDVVGKWSTDEVFDDIIASQRQIDDSKWK